MSKIAKAWHRFIQQNFNIFMRSGPNLYKERRYANVAIKHQFEEVEKKRKEQRIALIEYHKKLKKKILEGQLALLEKEKTTNININSLPNADAQTKSELAKQAAIARAEQTKDSKQKGKGEAKLILEQGSIGKKGQPKLTGEELRKELAEIDNQLVELKKAREELAILDKKLEDLEPNHILVEGLTKKMVLNQIAYFEFQYRNMAGVVMHPESIRDIEIVHYHVENNLPIRRELLFEVCPDLFETEIGQLDKYEQQRIRSRRPEIMYNKEAKVTSWHTGENKLPKEDGKFFVPAFGSHS